MKKCDNCGAIPAYLSVEIKGVDVDLCLICYEAYNENRIRRVKVEDQEEECDDSNIYGCGVCRKCDPDWWERIDNAALSD